MSKETFTIIPDAFWADVKNRYLNLGYDPEFVDQEIELNKTLSLDFEKHPEGDSTVKRAVIFSLEERERQIGGTRKE